MRRNIVSYDNFDSWGEHLPGFRLVDSVARLRFLDCNFINLTVEPSGFKYRTTFNHFRISERLHGPLPAGRCVYRSNSLFQ